MSHTPLPWRITEPTEKKTREIVGANGETVARLTALDMDNAALIVKCVNAYDPELMALAEQAVEACRMRELDGVDVKAWARNLVSGK